MFLLKLDGLGAFILLMLFLMFGVPLILLITGIALRKKNKKKSNGFFIAAAVYTLIGLGVCGSLMI